MAVSYASLAYKKQKQKKKKGRESKGLWWNSQRPFVFVEGKITQKILLKNINLHCKQYFFDLYIYYDTISLVFFNFKIYVPIKNQKTLWSK